MIILNGKDRDQLIQAYSTVYYRYAEVNTDFSICEHTMVNCLALSAHVSLILTQPELVSTF